MGIRNVTLCYRRLHGYNGRSLGLLLITPDLQITLAVEPRTPDSADVLSPHFSRDPASAAGRLALLSTSFQKT